MPRSNDCIGGVGVGKSSASSGGFDTVCLRHSAENCEVGVVFVGVVHVGVASEGKGAAEFSALSCSVRRRKMVAGDPERDRFRCANRRCRTAGRCCWYCGDVVGVDELNGVC